MPKKILTVLGYTLTGLILGTAIFYVGYLIGKNKVDSIAVQNGKLYTTNEVSVGFTNSDNIMIYNYQTKQLEMYSKEIGQFIYNSVSAKLMYGQRELTKQRGK